MRPTLAGLMLLLAGALCAQAQPTPYDCQFSATFTAAVVTTNSYYNRGPTAPCIAWRLTYNTVNATGVTIRIQGASNDANGNPDPGTWADLTATQSTTNPTSGIAAGTIVACCDYAPWIRVTATTFTGVGQTMNLSVFGYRGTSANRTTTGTGNVTTSVNLQDGHVVIGNGGQDIKDSNIPSSTLALGTGPFTNGNIMTGAGAQDIQDSGIPAAGLFSNPMNALGDMIFGQALGTPDRVPGNTTSQLLFLSMQGNGTDAAAPAWRPVPAGGTLTFYHTNTASDIAGDLQQTVTPYNPKTTLAFPTPGAGSSTLKSWATIPGTPNLTFIPAGAYGCHLHADHTAGSVDTLSCQFWEVSAAGADIAMIGESESTPALTTSETEHDLFYVDPNVYTMASSSSRIVCRIRLSASTGVNTVNLFIGGTADAHTLLPSNTVDASNFVPYSGNTGPVTFTDQTTPANPAALHTKFYTKAGLLCSLDSAGNEQCTGGIGAPPITWTDIATPAAPPAGSTKFYTKGGKFCALDSGGTETCTGSNALPYLEMFLLASAEAGNTLAYSQATNIDGAGTNAILTASGDSGRYLHKSAILAR